MHKSAMLGEENKGFIYLMTELPQERLLIACQALASAGTTMWQLNQLQCRLLLIDC